MLARTGATQAVSVKECGWVPELPTFGSPAVHWENEFCGAMMKANTSLNTVTAAFLAKFVWWKAKCSKQNGHNLRV